MGMSIYGDAFYDSYTIKMWARYMLNELPPEATFLISSGSSGCAIASAMIALSERHLQHYYIRKDTDDSSHWKERAGYQPSGLDFCVVVDDIVATGKTLKSIARKSVVKPRLALIAQDFRHCSPVFKVPFEIKCLEIGGI